MYVTCTGSAGDASSFLTYFSTALGIIRNAPVAAHSTSAEHHLIFGNGCKTSTTVLSLRLGIMGSRMYQNDSTLPPFQFGSQKIFLFVFISIIG
jgi:hypothetical protein